MQGSLRGIIRVGICGVCVWMAHTPMPAQHNLFLSEDEGGDIHPTNVVSAVSESETNSPSAEPSSLTEPEPPSHVESIPVAFDDNGQMAPASENIPAAPASDPSLDKLCALNETIWEGGELWQQDAVALAAKLGLSSEGKSGKSVSTFRSYGGKQIHFDGITPSTIGLIGDPDRVAELGFVFINQGDFFGDLTGSEDKKIFSTRKNANSVNKWTRKKTASNHLFLKYWTNNLARLSWAQASCVRKCIVGTSERPRSCWR